MKSAAAPLLSALVFLAAPAAPFPVQQSSLGGSTPGKTSKPSLVSGSHLLPRVRAEVKITGETTVKPWTPADLTADYGDSKTASCLWEVDAGAGTSPSTIELGKRILVYGKPGTYRVKVTVVDFDAKSVQRASVSVTMQGDTPPPPPPDSRPVISSLTPVSGPAGTSVVVTGSNLSGVTSATVGGTPVGRIRQLSPSTVELSVPAGSTTGKVTVTSPSGTAVSPVDFVVSSTPVDPAPIPVPGFRVLILYDSATLARLPKEQLNVLYDKSIRDYLNSKCAPGPAGNPGKKDWRIWDAGVDATGEGQMWVDALKRPHASLPWVIVSTGTTGYEGPLPPNVADTLTLLRKYGDVASAASAASTTPSTRSGTASGTASGGK